MEWRPLLPSAPTPSLPPLTHLQMPNFMPQLYTHTYEKMIVKVNEQLQVFTIVH